MLRLMVDPENERSYFSNNSEMCSNLCKIFDFIQRYYSSLKSSDVIR